MKYVPPIGGDPNDPYIDANPGAGIQGSAVPAAALEHAQREIVNVITDAGLVPNEADLTQLSEAIYLIAAAAAIPPENKLLIIEDQKPNGTNGQALTINTWNKRILNTVLRNDIGGSPLSDSQITLPAGDYELFYTVTHNSGLDGVSCRLRDVTNGVDLSIALSGEYGAGAGVHNFHSSKSQTFTLAAPAVLELQSNPYNNPTYGAGRSANRGVTEVYAQVVFRKVG